MDMKSIADCDGTIGNNDCIEKSLWDALDLGKVSQEMESAAHAPGMGVDMGTGRTNNACEMCSNSNTTAGCGGC